MTPKYYNIILILLIGLLGYEVLVPMYTGVGSLYQPVKGYHALKDSIATKEAALQEAQKIIDQSKSLQKKYKDVKPEQLELMSQMIPDTIDEVKLRSEITSILVRNGFSAEKASFNNTGGGTLFPGVYAFTVSLSIEDASYEKIKTFIALLERSRRILAIKSVNVSPAPKVGDLYKFDMSIETYSINPSK